VRAVSNGYFTRADPQEQGRQTGNTRRFRALAIAGSAPRGILRARTERVGFDRLRGLNA